MAKSFSNCFGGKHDKLPTARFTSLGDNPDLWDILGDYGRVSDSRLSSAVGERETTERERIFEQDKEAAPEGKEVAAMIDTSHLLDHLASWKAHEDWLETADEDCLETDELTSLLERVLSRVTFRCEDIFKEPLSTKLDLVSHFPKPIYKELVRWIKQQLEDFDMLDFISWSFNYFVDSVLPSPLTEREPSPQYSPVSYFATFAMILRTEPTLLAQILPDMWAQQRWYKKYASLDATPFIVWMIHQASQSDIRAGLYLWAHHLLPLVVRDTQCRSLILEFFERILAKPKARNKFVNYPIWRGHLMVPFSSFEILLRLGFPATSATQEDTRRFVEIYHSLKQVVLAAAVRTEFFTESIFTISLRLVGKGISNKVGHGNSALAKEATKIAIWFMNKKVANVVCWKHWYNICKENEKASVALLTTLFNLWNDHSLKPSSPSSSSSSSSSGKGLKAMRQFTRQMFMVSLRLVGEGNSPLAKVATKIAIWSLSENVHCWRQWGYLCKKNLESSVTLLKRLVSSKGYQKNLESSVTLLKRLVDHLLEQSSSSTEARKQFVQQMFTVSLRLAGEGNAFVAEEATAIAIWSLTENVDCCTLWDDLYKENLEASVALLKTLVDKWDMHSLKLSSSPSDTLTLSRTMKSFRLKNKEGITEGGANASLYKEADKSCKVLSRKISSRSLKGTCIISAVVAAIAALVMFYLSVCGFL